MPVSSDEFRQALSRFASGVTVVTTVDSSGELHGLTVSAFSSVSLSPPLVLVCIEKATASHFAFIESGAFAVNILSEDQVEISEHFATPLADKFASIEHRAGFAGVPVLLNSLANLECRLVNDFHGGDHSIFVGQVERAEFRGGAPLIYFHHGYHRLDRSATE
jgi:flavin reductase (DIM6/NTAB) family NADH-FMN oxidoreductase RutF